MGPRVKRITNSVKLGDNPIWEPKTQSFYFVDIYGHSLHKYYPALKKHTTIIIGSGFVSVILPMPSKTFFLINTKNELIKISWKDNNKDGIVTAQKFYRVHNVPNSKEEFTLSSAKFDASGRIWAQLRESRKSMEGEASIEPDRSCLISIDSHKNTKVHWIKLGYSNGFTWSPDSSKFYYSNSYDGTIEQYTFDIETATILINTRKVIFTLKKFSLNGFPSGITTDCEGNLWVAVFNGYHVIKISPKTADTLLQAIPLPAKQITNLVFGGSKFDKLFVTTGAISMSDVDEQLLPPYNGAAYVITGLDIKGYPVFNQ